MEPQNWPVASTTLVNPFLDTAGADAQLKALTEQMIREERSCFRAEHGRLGPSGQEMVLDITSAASGVPHDELAPANRLECVA